MVQASAILGSVAALLALAAGCAHRPVSPPEARNAAVQMKLLTLADLYRLRPDAKEHIRRSPGYAVFSNAESPFLPPSESDGYGVATDNRTGRVTFMRMAQAADSADADAEEAYRAVYVFDTPESFDAFLAGVDPGRGARSPDAGPLTVYRVTEADVTIARLGPGTRYYRDPELN